MNKAFGLIILLLSTITIADTTTSQPTTQPAFIIYNGKPRTEAWFDRIWKEIGIDTVEVDGQIENLNELISQDRLFVVRGEILQIINKNECLITNRSSDDIARVLGFSAKGLTDGSALEISAVRCGTYQYKSVAGSIKTIKNYVVPAPVTKHAFKNEIENGLILNRWRRINVIPNKKKANWQEGLIVEEKTIDTPNGMKTLIRYYRLRAYPIN